MKIKLLYCLLFLCSINLVNAQTYQPVLTSGAFWDIGYYSQDMSPCVPTPGTRYVLGDDITINNVVYKQLKYHVINSDDDFCPSSPFIVENNFTIEDVYIREDITEKRVYILSHHTTGNYQEYLLCDFNLEVGDLLLNAYGIGDAPITDIQTDANGTKTFYAGEYSYTEGIGGIGGIISTLEPQFEYYSVLMCHGNVAANENNCSRFLAVEDLFLSSIKLYPNPIEKDLFIETEIPLKITIFSILGKEINNYNISNNTTIDMSNINKGIYFVKVENSDKLQRTFKIVKK